MEWLRHLEPELPPHCTPTNQFLVHLSSYFGSCVPTPLALISTALGTLSIVSWLFAQLPQIYKNYKIKSTAGLSVFFLAEWMLGDLTNLLGCLFTQQAGWQIIIACYYTFVDICLVVQYFWYTHIKRAWRGTSLHSSDLSERDDGDSDVINALSPINTEFSEMMESHSRDVSKSPSEEPSTFFTSTYQNRTGEDATPEKISGMNRGSFAASPSVLAGVAIANFATPARAVPIPLILGLAAKGAATTQENSSLEYAGVILAWCSTLLYLGSRLPQLYKNWSRKSTAGLSPLLFIAAFCGNFFYSTSLLSNPNAWYDFAPFGGHGWVGRDGSDRTDWILRAAPFFLGAAGVLFMDGMMGIQFLLYSEREEEMIKVRDGHGHSRWEKVNGWMRGWVPMMSKSKRVDLAESQRLLAESREIDQYRRYGGVDM